MAASHPLLEGPAPARSSASSTELVVRTPKVIGTPVEAAASAMPCEAADAMYSKCAVAPLIKQPRQTTAAKRPCSAACLAANGISNDPGTLMTQMSSVVTPAEASASNA